MDQTFLNFIYAAAMSLLGWLGKTLWDAVQDLKDDMTQLEINLPKDYVSKQDYKEDILDLNKDDYRTYTSLWEKLFEKDIKLDPTQLINNLFENNLASRDFRQNLVLISNDKQKEFGNFLCELFEKQMNKALQQHKTPVGNH
mgnify:CR=1 FL=1